MICHDTMLTFQLLASSNRSSGVIPELSARFSTFNAHLYTGKSTTIPSTTQAPWPLAVVRWYLLTTRLAKLTSFFDGENAR
mmetsp:Transcript_23416/g.57608  ORF Transcript_23416/g.57608 Transcript_23416/m.57608 type:complete len:81 (-) Transcript_23416:938-1180(-)